MTESYYLNYAKNIFSQNGEDGIIEKLFSDLSITGGVVCEFGSWDGLWLSNVANLYLNNEKYKAILIESDTERFNESKTLFESFGNVELHNRLISKDIGSDDSLDNILSTSKFKITKSTFSLISIDVDSCDYHIFESMQKYKPKVVVIETNTNYSSNKEYISTNNGSSLKSINDLAKTKGYELVCHTGNAFFVRSDLIDKLPQNDYSINNLFVSTFQVENHLQRIKPDGSVGDNTFYLQPEYNDFIEKTKNDILAKI